MKLLIADDSPNMRRLLRRFFAAITTETRECEDGTGAVHVFDEFQPDWTLMDIAMPGMDGLTATREILASYPAARIVVVTQHRGSEYEQAARDAGACAFVRKENLSELLPLLSTSSNSTPTHI